MTAHTHQATTGTLTIGDQWNAITIIAHSQTHPLKAICELTENAIDAGARTVRIFRRRRRGDVFLELEDDGRGVACDPHGRPDFDRIATHLCDSMKRRLDSEHRRGVHGEFGIGLLSFWSLGDELRMTSAGVDGRASELRLVRGRREYEIRPVAGLLAASGTRLSVGPLLESTRNLVTGDKIARYLSAELRDRIRRTGVRIVVSDLVARGPARREVLVTPREFDGERLDIPRRYPTPLGDVQVEVYVRGEATPTGGISLCKDGTRVLPRIADLLPFQRSPWDDGRLEGIIDFEPLSLAPGTRGGVVADAALEALATAAETIGGDISAALAAQDEAETERASRHFLRQMHRAFVSAIRDLPAGEYAYFDIPRPDAEEHEPGVGGPADGRQARLFTGDPGPLATVRIEPRHPRVAANTEPRLSATPRDADGTPLAGRATLHWRITAGTAWLTAAGSGCLVRADSPGAITVEVVARQGDVEATDRVTLTFLAEGEAASAQSRRHRGLPSYRFEAGHGRSWRSRYETATNEVVVNSAHRDFLASRSSSARHRRYLGKLYAKEVVLSNFPHESPAEALERFVELTLRTDDAL